MTVPLIIDVKGTHLVEADFVREVFEFCLSSIEYLFLFFLFFIQQYEQPAIASTITATAPMPA